MTTRRSLLAAGAAASTGLLNACATGTRMSEMGGRIPPVPAGMGRVWFYRSASPFGGVWHPSITLNGQVVGRSVPDGAFFRDVPPGDYRAAMTVEVTRQLTFTVAPGEERFVSTYITPGIVAARPQFELVDPARGRAEVARRTFTGQT